MAGLVRRTFAEFESGLRLDDVLLGSVVEPEGHDNYIVNLNGYNVMAYSKIKLFPGMQIRARVTALKPHVKLIVIPGDAPREKMQSIDRAV
jgi:hypothetical protein